MINIFAQCMFEATRVAPQQDDSICRDQRVSLSAPPQPKTVTKQRNISIYRSEKRKLNDE